MSVSPPTSCITHILNLTCMPVSGLSAASQQDLSSNDLVMTRFSTSRSPSKNEETGDLRARGKDLAARCWIEDEEFLAKDKIAEWLGGQCVVRLATLSNAFPYLLLGALSTRLRCAITWIISTSPVCGWTTRSGLYEIPCSWINIAHFI